MQHLYVDLKQQKQGAVAVVTLDKQANVRLMTASNYRALKAGRRFSFHGGRATKSPVRLAIPNSLRRKIDQGIRASRFGIVILSERCFAKGWTNHELDGLVTRTVAGEQTLLPIWHNLTGDQVRACSPSLADKVALATDSMAVEEMAEQIAAVIRGETEDAA